jgi:hypothetical protein
MSAALAALFVSIYNELPQVSKPTPAFQTVDVHGGGHEMKKLLVAVVAILFSQSGILSQNCLSNIVIEASCTKPRQLDA